MKILPSIRLRLADKVIRQAIAFFVSILIIRFLDPEVYSEYILILAAVTILASFSNLGMADLLQFKFINRIDRIKNLAIAIRLRFITVSLGIVVIAGFFLVAHKSSLYLALIYCTSLYWQSLDIFEQYYLSRIRYETIIFQRLAITILFMLFKLAAAYKNNLHLLIGLICLEQALMGLIYLRRFRFNHLFVKIHCDQYFEFIKHIRSMFFANLLQGIRQRLDIIILGSLVSSYALASYAANTRISEGCLVLGSIFLNSINIEILKTFQNDSKDMASSIGIYRKIFFTTMIIIAPAIIFSEYILVVLFDGKYVDGYHIMQITLAGLPFAMMGYMTQLHFIARGSSNDILRVSFAGTSISLILLITFSVLWGALGAAFSIFLGLIIQCFLINIFAADKGIYQVQKKAIFFI